LEEKLKNVKGYAQFEYVNEELSHLMTAAADVFVSRAGANVIFELLSLRKPNLLIPLSAKAKQRRIKFSNAFLPLKKWIQHGFYKKKELNSNLLIKALNDLYRDRDKYIKEMNSSSINKGVEEIIKLIQQYTK
jgi:UDP-N-acetylglucosamine--N-acetylmuramyl-(pentapeptide) pyrophosphoryl-undecaprenol N-acetylglucosamine transferase